MFQSKNITQLLKAPVFVDIKTKKWIQSEPLDPSGYSATEMIDRVG